MAPRSPSGGFFSVNNSPAEGKKSPPLWRAGERIACFFLAVAGIVGGFLGDGNIVGMALDKAGAGNADKLGLFV